MAASSPARPLHDGDTECPARATLICYEAIFPAISPHRGDRPGWIVNLTNDGWVWKFDGPYQHLQQARLRAAMKEGLPVVRAANTGISAVIDPRAIVTPSASASKACWMPACRRPLPPTLYARLEIFQLRFSRRLAENHQTPPHEAGCPRPVHRGRHGPSNADMQFHQLTDRPGRFLLQPKKQQPVSSLRRSSATHPPPSRI